MDLRTALASNFNLQNLIIKGAYVICIAVAFELIAWWAASRLDKVTARYMGADAGREHNWRVRRRAILKSTPKIITRSICYTIAVILVFDLFGVPVLPLSLAVGAVIALFGSALLPLLRDASQGYVLLAEDALAVGDVVSINNHTGIVERFTLRGVALRDNEGNTHLLSNRDIQTVIVVKRRAEDVSQKVDPLAGQPQPRKNAPARIANSFHETQIETPGMGADRIAFDCVRRFCVALHIFENSIIGSYLVRSTPEPVHMSISYFRPTVRD